MDSILNEIVACVQKLLEEIHELMVEKDGSEVTNPAKAAYLQGQIFRTFAVIDSLLGSCSDSEVILEMRKDVSLKKKELNAEAKDLKLLAIPKLLKAGVLEEWKEDKKNKMEDPFAFLNLPPEVRRNILDYLTWPKDKLSLVKAIPGDGRMMEWSLDSLQWELVLPLLFKGNYGLTYADTVNLCRASPDIYAAVKNCFERNSLRVSDITQRTTVVGGGEEDLSELSASDFILNPLPVTIELHFHHVNGDDQSVAEQLETLRQVGVNIWSLTFCVEVQYPASTRQALQVIRDTLALTPNLKSLFFWFFHHNELDDNEEVEAFQDIHLPELPHLRRLRFVTNDDNGVVQCKLLEKYRPLIKRLQLSISDNHLLNLNLPAGEPGYRQLTHLQAWSNPPQNSIIGIFANLETFVGVPLQTINLGICNGRNDVDTFRTILCFLSRFGDTLKRVLVKFSSSKVRHVEVNKLGWLASINFPKVKRLNLVGHPFTWTFLLCFPVVAHLDLKEGEDLEAEDDDDSDDESRYFDSSPDILELSLNQEDMWSSNVWKLFPFLKTIKISGCYEEPFQVTRSQCLALQRRLAKVMMAIGPVYSTATGTFRSIVHSDDRGLVFNGNVNGNVIQEGDGSILVNGYVKGNIEQKGDGKIFVRGKHTGEVFQTGNGTVEVDWGNVKS